MFTRRRLLTLAMLVAGSLATTTASKACEFGGGYGWGAGLLYNSLEYRVPYFAAHPPVYYSYPVPRTYGHSPFAYPPHFRTPEVVGATTAIQISNPYYNGPSIEVKPAETINPTVSNPTPAGTTQPLTIHNPYASDSVELVQAAR